MTIIYSLIAFMLGFAIAYLLRGNKIARIENQWQNLKAENEKLTSHYSSLESENLNLREEKNTLRSQCEIANHRIEEFQHSISIMEKETEKKIAQLNDTHHSRYSDIQNQHQSEIASIKEGHAKLEKEWKEQIESERNQSRILIESANQRAKEIEASAKAMREENDKQWQLKLDKIKEEFQNLSSQLLANKQTALQEANKEQIGELLKPIKEQFMMFQKSVEESRTSTEVAKKELKNSFEATMKLFEQQQNQTVAALREETARIGNDAANLTKVLRRDSKVQGDWGEMILDSLLESSGLERDVHYFVQENVKDEEGRNFRPDVIVKFPEGRSVIIDSKVSLTAYAEAYEAEDETTRLKKLKEHARSVRRHVDELAGKKYENLVSDSIGLVLMFIPNDQSYLAAIEQEKDLGRYAYSKGIVIISPSNLMIALQLAFNMWQQDRQTKNVETIVKTANELYEKVAGFSETLEDIETHILRLSTAFNKAKNQLYDGKGNILRRVEGLKNLGITPKKQIRGLDNID